MMFGEVFKTSQIRLKKDVFLCKVFETSQKLLEKGDVSSIAQERCLFGDVYENVSKTSLTIICGFFKISYKNDFVLTRCHYELSSSTETSSIDVNQVCHKYDRADICVRVLANQRSSKRNKCVLFTTFSDFIRLIKL